MNILEFIKSNKKHVFGILVMVILIIAIPVTVYLAQTQQIFKSRAGGGDSFLNAFEVRDSEGNILSCDHSTNPPTCTTSTQDVSLTIRDLNFLMPK